MKCSSHVHVWRRRRYLHRKAASISSKRTVVSSFFDNGNRRWKMTIHSIVVFLIQLILQMRMPLIWKLRRGRKHGSSGTLERRHVIVCVNRSSIVGKCPSIRCVVIVVVAIEGGLMGQRHPMRRCVVGVITCIISRDVVVAPWSSPLPGARNSSAIVCIAYVISSPSPSAAIPTAAVIASPQTPTATPPKVAKVIGTLPIQHGPENPIHVANQSVTGMFVGLRKHGEVGHISP
mmetsp:Transcript_13181/g.25813  ORF Transcript_13181/g.25813 Transcript_13181/m.25813 type:complete len:233 (+) Transcript_13181:1774-2472(+)